MSLDAQIEALLFFKAEPVKISTLAKILNVPKQNIRESIARLDETLTDRGLQLIHKEDSVMLTTNESVSDLIAKVHQEELETALSKAALETLSVILYHGPVTRSDIDYIRGVNSSYMLRTLLIRGLVERKVNPRDKRGHVYTPTFELLQHLGVSRVSDLPEYQTVRGQIHTFAQEADVQAES